MYNNPGVSSADVKGVGGQLDGVEGCLVGNLKLVLKNTTNYKQQQTCRILIIQHYHHHFLLLYLYIYPVTRPPGKIPDDGETARDRPYQWREGEENMKRKKELKGKKPTEKREGPARLLTHSRNR